jgi:hypothetical protein
LAAFLVIDAAVFAFLAWQWLGHPGLGDEAQEDAEQPSQFARFPGDLREEGLLKVGDLAPDFQLTAADGKSTVTLSRFRGRKPVVLIFGSYSCPIFRRQFDGLKQMVDRYRQEAEFFVVYIQEAHPIEGRRLPENAYQGISIAEHKTLEDRHQAAMTCAAALGFKLPVLVDNMDNRLRQDYAAWPVRLYVVGQDGRIAMKGESSPERFTLAAMVGALERVVQAANDGVARASSVLETARSREAAESHETEKEVGG